MLFALAQSSCRSLSIRDPPRPQHLIPAGLAPFVSFREDASSSGGADGPDPQQGDEGATSSKETAEDIQRRQEAAAVISQTWNPLPSPPGDPSAEDPMETWARYSEASSDAPTVRAVDLRGIGNASQTINYKYIKGTLEYEEEENNNPTSASASVPEGPADAHSLRTTTDPTTTTTTTEPTTSNNNNSDNNNNNNNSDNNNNNNNNNSDNNNNNNNNNNSDNNNNNNNNNKNNNNAKETDGVDSAVEKPVAGGTEENACRMHVGPVSIDTEYIGTSCMGPVYMRYRGETPKFTERRLSLTNQGTETITVSLSISHADVKLQANEQSQTDDLRPWAPAADGTGASLGATVLKAHGAEDKAAELVNEVS